MQTTSELPVVPTTPPLRKYCSKCGGQLEFLYACETKQCGWWTSSGTPRADASALFECQNGHQQIGKWWLTWDGHWIADSQYPKDSLFSLDGEDITKEVVGVVLFVIGLFLFISLA